ncbi:MAG: DegV family protein [Acholeplasmatales bacterium]|nr:DegV family protein [Acholeplasmatales bacterium]
MNNYKIFVDLACDLDKDFAINNNIGYIPMKYMIDDVEFLSDKILSEEESKHFYDEMKNNKVTKTSQITPFVYEEFFEEYAQRGESILYFTLSSGLSNTYNSALVAKNTLCEKHKDFKFEIVDSLGATGGIGVLVHKAVENKKNGMSLEENANSMRETTKNLKHWFYVEDLKYLKRGGRISSSKAFIANALNIKPVMKVNSEGKLEAFGKKIGIKRCQHALVDNFIESFDSNNKVVYICHGDDLNSALNVKKLLLEFNDTLEIYITSICPIIGSHAGPGTIALCHIGK